MVAVDNLSFVVEPGTVTGFLGPNGAGKTTTLRMMLGLVAPSSGSALVNGVAYHDLPDPTRAVGGVLYYDEDALASQGYANEQLDQLVTELLLGIR